MAHLSEQHLKNLIEDSLISIETLSSAGVFSASSQFCKDEYNITGLTGIAFPYHNLTGEVIGYRVRKDIDDEHGKYMQKAGTKLALYFPSSEAHKIQSKDFPLIITEGEKKCLSLISNIPKAETYAFVAIPGCWNFRDSNTKDVHETIKNLPLSGRRIIFIGDSDMFYNYKIFCAYMELIQFFISQGAKVELADLRINDFSKKVGADDFIKEMGISELIPRLKNPYWCFSKGTSVSDFKSDDPNKNKIIREALKESILESDPLVIQDLYDSLKSTFKTNLSELKAIRLNYVRTWNTNSPKPESSDSEIFHNPNSHSIKEIAIEICNIISRKENLFLNAEANSFIEIIEHLKDKKFKAITTSEELSALLPRYLNYNHVYLSKEGTTQILRQDHIPPKILSTILSHPREFATFKEIEFISKAPTFSKDHIVHTSGYHALEKVYIDCEQIPKQEGLFHLNKILNSFPFIDEASKQNALAFFVSQTLFLNEFIGDHPAVIISGDSSNVGKTTLAHISCIIANGEQGNTLKFHVNNDAENEKNIASVIQSSNIIFFDNIRSSGMIESACLEKSITDHLLHFRLLGRNVMTGRLNNVQCIFTVNNGKFSEDLINRSIPIFLSENSNKKIDHSFEVKTYALKHRKEILGELVHIVNKWIEHGMPSAQVNFPKFPKWASWICGILKTNGMELALTNFDNAKAVLDHATESILMSILDEIVSNKTFYTAKKSSDFVSILAELKIEGFSNTSQKSKETRVGNILRKLDGRTISIAYSENIYKLKIERSQDSKGGSNTIYKFSAITSVTSSLGVLNEKENNLLSNISLSQSSQLRNGHDLKELNNNDDFDLPF